MDGVKAAGDVLLEVSWEVCNKVGGIYTVISSKAALTKQHYKEYYLIGPYFEDRAKVDLEEAEPPQPLKGIFEALSREGIAAHFGRWQIPGEPTTILLEFRDIVNKKNGIKAGLWEQYRIDSYEAGWDFDEPVVWSFAVARLITLISEADPSKKIVTQFHEWLAGSALLHLRGKKIATIFTTHATMLGRAIAGSGSPLYDMLDSMNPEEEAYRHRVQAKFFTERACAQNATIFTTVSEITAIEAEKILGRKADVLVLNGLDINKFPTPEEAAVKHVTCRNRLREYLAFHFLAHYALDIKDVMLFFTVARYEFRNKGIDVFIESLGKLNQRLIAEKSEKAIAAFFWVPLETHGIKMELLENKNHFRHIKHYIQGNAEQILQNITNNLMSNMDLSRNIFSKEFVQSLRKDIINFKRSGNPALVTHHLNDEEHDPILSAFRFHGLLNRESDRVKVILHPVYLNGNDGLVDLAYYDAMAGCHLGVFSSYYEPWGYTPLEAAALNVPAIASDLSGFGRFIDPKLAHDMNDGIFVHKRYRQSYEQQVAQLSELLYAFSKRDKHLRAKNKLNAKELATLADWKELIANYITAHNLALDRVS
ncbi:TPA: glycosyltransferase [Candidatus Woesearchaeota archaeon]|nr:glycosyltransferase [Candidatus Woesearchaeota archaeon]HII68863.1 glycosyltransferase [Candidatus Woesearchaeota archaeon]